MTENISQIEFLKRFNSNQDCLDYINQIKFPNGVICPFCQSTKIYTLIKNNYPYKCPKCGNKFSSLKGTIFEGSRIPLQTWFFLIYGQAINLKTISSHQMSTNLGLTQKTMWGMHHKLRNMLKQDESVVLSGVVEIDEAFVSKGNQWTRWGGITTRKTPILGMIERGGKLVIKLIEDRKRSTLVSLIDKYVEKGSTIYTDGHASYQKLPDYYIHEFVEHSTGEYVRGIVHTNNIEAVWSRFKKSIRHAHHQVSAKHLELYCNQMCWQHNNRHLEGYEKFNAMMQLCLNETINIPKNTKNNYECTP